MKKISLIFTIAVMILCKMTMGYSAENLLQNVFNSDAYHYSIHYPANWKMADRGNGVILFTHNDGDSNHLTINM